MLRIVVPAVEKFDEERNEFIQTKEQVLQLEHSLVSISKWEAKWRKPFLVQDEKSIEETLDYIRCMTITQNVDPNVYSNLSRQNLKDIDEYIKAPMTATWFSDANGNKKKGRKNGEVITAEIIYYWMFASGIPIDCQKWHLNRLLTLIEVFEKKSEKPKKMSQKEIYSKNHALNAARRKAHGTKG